MTDLVYYGILSRSAHSFNTILSRIPPCFKCGITSTFGLFNECVFMPFYESYLVQIRIEDKTHFTDVCNTLGIAFHDVDTATAEHVLCSFVTQHILDE